MIVRYLRHNQTLVFGYVRKHCFCLMLENIVFACFYMCYKPHNALFSVLLLIVIL